MRNNMRRLTALFVLIALIIVTVVPTFAAGQPASYSKSKNSGERDVICTTLDGTSAEAYYTNNDAEYEDLSKLSKSALLSTLRTLMKTTHTKQTSYDNCRDYADETDCENGNGKITTIYTSYQTTQSAYNSGNGWNREHVWPKSLGGFNTSGAGADLHHIRPSENKTNGDRGSLKYGEVSGGSQSKGNLSGLLGGYKGSYYEPLDNVKGDVARICLYVYVRYGGELSKCNSITNVFQSVDVLLAWCELDPVDTWEMGRNEVVQKIQGNRNVFIDYPEYAWLIFGKAVPEGMTTPTNSENGGSGGNVTPSCTHSNTEMRNVKAATCGTTGYTGDTYCLDCNKTVTAGSVIAATGKHTWGEPVVITPPTITSNGTQKYTCSVCNSTKNETIPKLDDPNDNCSHTNTEIRNEIIATCGRDGYTGDTYCVDCDTKLSSGFEVQSTGDHTWGEAVIITPPTANSDGEQKYTCSVCGKEKTESVPKLDSPADDPIDPPVDDPVNPPVDDPTDDPAEKLDTETLIIIAVTDALLKELLLKGLLYS